MSAEKLVKKTVKLIAESIGADYAELKKLCKRILRDAKNADETLLGQMEELLDISDVASEEELADIDIEVLKIYCRIKELDHTGSEKHIRKAVWEHIESEFDFDESDDSGDEVDSESEEEEEPEPAPVIIKKQKKPKGSSEKPNSAEVVNES